MKRRAKAVDDYQFAKAFRNIFVKAGIIEENIIGGEAK